ncbi:olfactomedin-4-like [Amphiprion ocellaris]|uniref:Olfactomedin-like domain-containing protein n=1 Tax=Amphiprion ocellaris TaxID=80972 RepID=A0A3Q1C971_AMPOC|nr:olfactomedin-4-like [Amphiprion ocellaris]
MLIFILCSTMKLLLLLVLLWTLSCSSLQAPSRDKCSCELKNSEKVFPHDRLKAVDKNASDCNSRVTPQKAEELEVLLLGLDRRLVQLQEDVSVLEKEDDGDLYGVLSLNVIHNEMTEIRLLLDKLNTTTEEQHKQTAATTHRLTQLKAEMEDLEQLDSMEVVKQRRTNHRLRTSLNRCLDKQNATVAPTQPLYGTCSQGPLKNVTGPWIQTAGEYPGSYPYGSWGRDPKPEPGKERWYWMVPMTSNNRHANYVRLYHSLYKLIGGETNIANVLISSSNPTTNTIQGPNVVLYGGSLYYNCYNQRQVCRFHLTTKTVTNVNLPQGTRYNSKGNFCHLDECYPYTDLDLATDESGVWVVYTTTQDFGNLVLSKVEEGEPPKLNQTWHTSVFKQGVTNTFVACGVLYATRYVSKDVEEIFYSFDTTTGKERFDVGIFVNKMSTNIQALNYSPVDQMLYAYCDSNMVSYKVLFG